jgi:large subunit ribosomal protein L4
VYDIHGKRTAEILEFDPNIFGEEVRQAVLKEAILMYEANQRLGTHQTKTRAQVAGSGRKLWRQKGTGRARVGPARAPHWPGGGRVFGPHPRDYSYSIPKKARRVALDSAWLAKFQDKHILITEGFDIKDTPKTSSVFTALEAMGVTHRRTLIGIPQYNEVVWKSFRNIPTVSVEQISHFSPYILLVNDHVVLLRQAFEELIKSRGGEIKSLNRKEIYS